MFSPKIKYFLYGSLLSTSLITLVTQAASSDGVFGTYFENIIKDAGTCGSNTVITGFNQTHDAAYGTQECTTFDLIVKSVLGVGSAPLGQAIIGISSTGSAIFGDVNWTRSGSQISYIAGNVGIGTNLPTTKLDVQGNTRIGGDLAITSNANIANNANIVGNATVTGAVNTNTLNAGNANINTATVNGILKITGGSPGNGKVLTSDASGNASWQTVSGGGGTFGSRVSISAGVDYCPNKDAFVFGYKRSAGAVLQGLSITVGGVIYAISTGQSEGHLGYSNVFTSIRQGECFRLNHIGGGGAITAWYMPIN